MDRWKYVCYRIGWSVAAVYAVVTLMFVLLSIAPDYSDAALLLAEAADGADPEELSAMEQALSEDGSTFERYVRWIVGVATLDFGTSELYREPVTDVIASRAPITLAYVLPGTLAAFAGATALGYVSAVRRNSPVDYLISGSAYLVLSLPNFLIAGVLLRYVREHRPLGFPVFFDAEAGVLDPGNARWLALPAVVLGTHLLAVYLRYTRAEALEYLEATFVKIVRSKGASRLRVAWHVFRNAAVPLVTLFVAELIGVLLVTVFVLEAVFEVDGLGQAAYVAVQNQDLELVLALTLLVAVAVIVSNLLQDLVYALLDPRLDAEQR